MSKKEKQAKPEKTEKAPGKKNASSKALPALFDVSFSISKLVVLLMGALTSAISVISGATALAAAMRGCLAMLAVGITLWLINWIMVRESLEGVLIKVNKLKAQNSEDMQGASTFEKNA
jgi:hypothetical protein